MAASLRCAGVMGNVGVKVAAIHAINLVGSSSLALASADSSVATVDNQGLVTAVGPGETVIDLTFSGSSAGSVPIRVTAPPLIPSVTSLSFGHQAVAGQGQSQTFTLRNALSYPLRMLDAASSNEFHETSDCQASSPIPASGSCTIRVWFAPRAPGSRNGAISIISSAVVAPTVIYLNGVGTR